jgi:hypothetical protein
MSIRGAMVHDYELWRIPEKGKIMKERIHEYGHRFHLLVMEERWFSMVEYVVTLNMPYSEFLFRLFAY